MADIVKTVGDGHALPDYATLTLWNAAESVIDPGVGFTSIAECSGDIGVSATVNGVFPRGAVIRGDIQYDGANQSALAMLSGNLLLSSENITATDLFVTGSASPLGNNALLTRCRVLGGIGYDSSGTTGKLVSFSVISSSAGFVVAYGGGDQGDLENNLIFGTSGTGVITGGGGGQNLSRNFSFNNGGNDYQGATDTFVDNASEDLTGNLTGYTSAEFVDFDNNDFRIKSTSDLWGVAGAFFEEGAGELNIVGSTPSYSFAVPLANVDLTGELSIVGSTPSYSYTVPLANVDLTGELNVVGSTPSYSFAVPLANVDLTGELNVVGSTPSYSFAVPLAVVDLTGELNVVGSTPSYSFAVPLAVVDLTGELNIVGSTPSYSFAVPLAVVDLTGELNIVGSTPSYSYTVPLADVDLTGDLSIVGTTPTYSYTAVRGVVSFSGGACLEIKGDITLNSKQFSGHDHKAPVACFESISGSVTIDSFNK